MKKLIINPVPTEHVVLKDLVNCPLWCGIQVVDGIHKGKKYLLAHSGGDSIFSQEEARGSSCWDFEGSWKTLLEGWARREHTAIFIFQDAREMCEWYLK